MTIETVKHAMYTDLKCLRLQKKHPILLARFEDKLEQYLEALRQESEHLVHYHAENMVLRDAYEHQKQLTHTACAAEREIWNTNREFSSQIRELETANESGYAELRQTILECDRLRASNEALVSVIETQQIALVRSERGLREAVMRANDQKLELSLLHGSSYREIMVAEKISKDLYEQMERCDAMVMRQFKRIEWLQKQLAHAKKPLINRIFAALFSKK